jgi:hypothetical protein
MGEEYRKTHDPATARKNDDPPLGVVDQLLIIAAFIHKIKADAS